MVPPPPSTARTTPPLWSMGPPGEESPPKTVSVIPSPFTSTRAGLENTVSSV